MMVALLNDFKADVIFLPRSANTILNEFKNAPKGLKCLGQTPTTCLSWAVS